MRSVRILAFALMTALAGACVSTQAPAGAQTHVLMQQVFVIEYRPGPAWQAGVPMNRQALGPHAAYWTRLAREGRAIGAGPYLDVDGGMAMIIAASNEEARAIVAADPAVTNRVFVADLHAWSPRIRGAGDLPR
jgi:uncharacterized protein YciI